MFMYVKHNMSQVFKTVFNFSLLMLLLSSGCVPFLPGSRQYQPADWESSLIEESNKLVMPDDVRSNPYLYLDALIHWVGIVDTVTFDSQDQEIISRIHLDQKYFDYIEDYSIQQEIFFLSPLGEGSFILEQRHENTSPDSLKNNLIKQIPSGSLAFCYGILTGVDNNIPIMEVVGFRVFDERAYSTNIWKYNIQRDELGNVIAEENGFPKIGTIEILSIPGPGAN